MRCKIGELHLLVLVLHLLPPFRWCEMRMIRATSKLLSPTHPSLNLAHPTPDCFTWNTVLRAHVIATATTKPPDPSAPLLIYHRMRLHGVRPDLYTFPFLLQSFDTPSYLLPGCQIHAHVLCYGLISDPFAQSSLVTMYSSCGSLDAARRIFAEIPCPDLPTWNSMVSCNLRSGFLDVARRLFDCMPERNVVSWSCMIDGYVKCGDYRGAIRLFRDMQQVEGVSPNEFTMSSVLSACGKLGTIDQGRSVHAYIDRFGMEVNAVLGTSLIDMYAKCGCVEKARSVFDQLGDERNVWAWSVMISGLAMHGRVEEAFALFHEMLDCKIRPSDVTFLGVFCACVHGGFVDECEGYFDMMKMDFGIVPIMQHYGCIVDLYSRVGMIDKAWGVINSMPMKPDVLIWGALLSGSRLHGEIGTCEIALKQLIELEPMNSGAFVLLSNIYARQGRWDDARHVRNLMEAKGIRKTPGRSLIEVGGDVHEFFVADRSHPEAKEIYLMLDEIMDRLKVTGYVANTGETLYDLDEEGKDMTLSVHSEKFVVPSCVVKTSPGTPVSIFKKLRIWNPLEILVLAWQIFWPSFFRGWNRMNLWLYLRKS